jgi:hypothetical protein
VISAVPAIVSIAMAALLGVAGYAGPTVLIAAIALVVLGLAAGWGTLLDLPDPRGTGFTVAVTGLAGLAVVHRSVDSQRPLAAFAGLLAFGVVTAFLHELARRDGRPDLARSVTGTFVGQMIAVLGSAWVLLPATPLMDKGVLVAAVASALAAALIAIPWPLRVGGWVALLGGAIGAGGLAFAMLDVEVMRAAAVGAGVASVFAVLYRMLVNEPTVARAWATLAAGLAPLASCGTAAYAAARLILG